MKKLFTILLFALPMVHTALAQSRSVPLTIEIKASSGESLKGQDVTLTQTDFSVDYEMLNLDADGQCSLMVYPGAHLLSVKRFGFETLSHQFDVEEGKPATVKLTINEMTRKPFAVTHTLTHNAMTGRNDVALGWNVEPPVFFDDFESYKPFAISFGDWTGIDGDGLAAAALVGAYPNRGVNIYCQIINPLTVEPTWWYEYPVLRPYSGKQYAGFIRTSKGDANNDWLISPVITPGTDNVLTFLAKAADKYPERFSVYVTEQTENPATSDFTRISTGNYETVDYRQWYEKTYDLSQYTGKQIRFAIRYTGDAKHYGAFMLMVDDVYVGPKNNTPQTARKRLGTRALRSPANPNESFEITLDGVLKGVTDGYSFLFEDIAAGKHTASVKAKYLNTESEPAEYSFEVPGDCYADVTFNVTADSKISADGTTLNLVNITTSETFSITVGQGKARIPYLPKGEYSLNVEAGAFESVERHITVDGDTTFDIELKDNITAPYNITAELQDDGTYLLRWNRELGFCDSFEEYPDFAKGAFGQWITLDNDKMPVYPIALGAQTNIVSFPGSGNASNPLPLAPLVFNPLATAPPMFPTDLAIAAPDGDKTIAFFSAQGAKNNKWLISPAVDIYKGYELNFLAKAYSSMYPEKLDIYWADTEEPDNFKLLSQIDQVVSDNWGEYTVPLDEFEGKTIIIGFNYVSFDSFLLQIDLVKIEPANKQGATIDYGNIDHFEIWVDGELKHTCTEPTFSIKLPDSDRHIIGICAVYKSGRSETTEYTIEHSGLAEVSADTTAEPVYFDTSGRIIDLNNAPAGIYIKTTGITSTKTIKQ